MDTSYCPPYTPMVEVLEPRSLPDGSHVEHFEFSENGLLILRLNDAMHRRGEYREVRLGVKYAKLIVDGKILMSDTPMERRTCLELLEHARGDVLIGGLGMGMVLVPLAAMQRVRSITVVEVEPRVVSLVWPQLTGLPGMDKVRIEEADILDWWPANGGLYDSIWFDIWPSIPNADDRPTMRTLHRRWCKRLRAGGWMSSWRKRDAYTGRRGGRR